MTDISDKIQQLKNLSGIFTGAGGDHIPPHGTTHTKNGPDPIPSELDGIPVDLEGMSTGETIVLDANGELVPGAALGSLTDLQTAYDNGGSVTLDGTDFTITLGNAKKLVFKDKDGNAAFTFEDVGADNQITINPDILKLKDSNVTTAIDLSSIGNVQFITTDKSIVGAVNELAAAAVNYFNKLTDDSDDITEGATNLFLTAAERAAIAGAYIKATDDATDIQMEIGNHDVQHLLDDLTGRGVIEGFSFTDDGGGSCTIGGGDVYLHTTSSKGSTGGVFTVPGDSFALTDNANNFIYAEYNGGSPQLQVTVNPTAIRYVEDKIIVHFIRRDGTTLRKVPFDSGWQSIHTILSQRFFEQAEGEGDTYARRLKGDVISTLGTRNPTISAGVYGAGTNRIETPVIDCTAGGTYTQFYGDSVNGFTYNTGQTQLNNTQYYNGAGGLTALNTSRYSVRWVWRLFSVTELYINISATNIIDLGDAIDSPVPTDVPPLVAQFGQLVGRYIVQQGSNTVTSLPRWTTTLSTSGVITHEATVDKNSEPEFQHYDQSPAAGVTALAVTDEVITGSNDTVLVKWREPELLTTATASSNFVDIIPGPKYVLGTRSVSGAMVFDRKTLKELYTTVNTPAFVRGTFISDTEIVYANTNAIYRHDIVLDTIISITATGVAANTRALCLSADKTKVFLIDSANELWSLTLDDNTVSDIGAIVGFSGIASDIACGGDGYLYAIEGPTAGGSAYVRKINNTTAAIAASSIALTVVASGIYGDSIYVSGTKIFVTNSETATSTKYVHVINKATLAFVFKSAAQVTDSRGQLTDGLLIGGNITALNVYKLPGLTQKNMGFIERSGDGVTSSPSVITPDGKTIYVTDSEQIKTVIKCAAVDDAPAGFIALDVVDYDGTEIGNAVLGQRYLIAAGSTVYPNCLFEMRQDGHRLWSPMEGMIIYDATSGDRLEYNGSAWVAVTAVRTFDTFADIDGAVGNAGDIAVLRGYYQTGDGGERHFTFDATLGPGDVNDVTIIDGGAGGCWVQHGIIDAVNIRWAGAVGDGVTDDLAAFAKCVAVGKEIFVPIGDYYIASPITITVDTKIICEKGATFIGTGYTALSAIFSVTAAVDTVFENAWFKTSSYGVKYSNAANVDFDDCKFTDIAHGISASAFNSTGYLRVHGCEFDDVEVGICIVSCSFKTSDIGGHNIFTSIEYKTIPGRTYPLDKEIVAGLFYQSTGVDASVTVSNNYVNGVVGPASAPTEPECHGLAVSLDFANDTDVVLSGNIIIDVDAQQTEGSEGLMGRGKRVIIADNILFDAGGREGCIYAKGSVYHKIENNTIEISLTNPQITNIRGVISTGSNCDINNNKFINTYIGIYTRALISKYTENEFLNCATSCISLALEDASTHELTVLTGNRTDSNCGIFFVVAGSAGSTWGDFVVRNNTLNNQNTAVSVRQCESLTFRENNVKRPGTGTSRDLVVCNGVCDLLTIIGNNILAFDDLTSTGRILTGSVTLTPRIVYEGNYAENGNIGLYLRSGSGTPVVYTDLIVRNNTFLNCTVAGVVDLNVSASGEDCRVYNVGDGDVFRSFLAGDKTDLDANTAARHGLAFHPLNALIQVESVVSSAPGSPSAGQYFLCSPSYPTYPDYIAYYNGSSLEYEAPKLSSRIFDKSKKYFREYKTDGWYATVDMRLFATTSDGASAGDTAYLALTGAVYPVLEAGETWSGRISIAARCPNGLPEVGIGESNEGHWAFDVTLCRADGTTYYTSHVNNTLPTSVPAVFTPISEFDQPSINIDEGTGEIKITVGHTSSSSNDVYWTAVIYADVASSRGFNSSPA